MVSYFFWQTKLNLTQTTLQNINSIQFEICFEQERINEEEGVTPVLPSPLSTWENGILYIFFITFQEQNMLN